MSDRAIRDVPALVAEVKRLRASLARLTDAAESVLTDADNECRHSASLKELRFAVLDVPIGALSVEQREEGSADE